MGEEGSPLHQACASGQARLAEALLATGRLGGYVNRPGPQGWCASCSRGCCLPVCLPG